LAADKLNSDALLHLFDLSNQDRANLPRRAHVRAPARGEVEIGNVNEAQLVFRIRRQFSQTQAARLLQAHKADGDWPVLEHHIVGELPGPARLLARQCRTVEINRADLVSHVK